MKNIVLVQNVDLSEDLAVSVFLKHTLKKFSEDKGLKVNAIVIEPKKRVELKNINIYGIDADLYSLKGNAKFIFGVYRNLKKINKENRIDVIDCFYPNSSIMGAVLFKIFNPRVKLVYQIRSPWIDMAITRKFLKNSYLLKRMIYLSEYFLSLFVDEFIFITEGLKEYYADKIRLKNNYAIIPSGVDSKLFRPVSGSQIRKRYGIKNNEKVIGMVGGIAKIRQYDFIIKSFNELIKEYPSYKLIVVGDGEALEEIKQLARQFWIQENVIFTGNIPHENVPTYICACNMAISHVPDIFVYRQSFPLKVLEYISCGVPVLASNINAHKEINKSLKNMFIYDYRPESFIEQVKRIDEIKFDKKDFDVIKERYDWGVIIQNIKKRY